MQPRKALVQFSIAEVITVITVLCLLIGMIWTPWEALEWIFLGIAVAALFAMALACTAIGETQTFAAGFSILFLGYLGLSIFTQSGKMKVLSPYLNELPTTSMWSSGYESLVHKVYRYLDSDEVIPSSLEPYRDSQNLVLDKDGNILGTHTSQNKNLRYIGIFTVPKKGTHRVAGELLWAVALGYVGGKCMVGFRRYQENTKSS